MSPGIVLASATSPTEQAVFEALVRNGIDREHGVTGAVPDGEQLGHAWPVPAADHVDPSAIDAGDYVLFYRGENRYTWAARIRRIETDRAAAQELTTLVNERTSSNVQPQQEFTETILWLEVPVPIELESYRLHDLLDIGQEALTRTVVPNPATVQSVVDEYGSIEEMLRTSRQTPSVYIEVTSLEDKPYKQPGGEFPLGTAAISRSESQDGRDIYGTLREAEVGDLVLHVLKDTRELKGVSTVVSTLRTDFEGPPDGSWDDEARGNGYYLPLGEYHEFDAPLDIDDDLLDNEDYRGRLQTIYDTNEGLVYDKNFELAQGAYFTECPLELLYLLLAESPALLDIAEGRYWDIDLPPAAEGYDSVSDAVVDVRTRLPFAEVDQSWFLDAFTETVLAAFTDSLSSVQPNAELTKVEATHCRLIQQLFTDREAAFIDAANRLGVGRTNQIGAAETLFFVLFRELQSAIGVSANMNQVKARTILNENYEVATPEVVSTSEEERGPLEPKPKPARGDQIARQLQDSGQMVFYGPPGTGKTYTATQFAHWWLNEQPGSDPHTGQFETVTFHPSFTYEDFVEGLSVDTDEEGVVTYDEEAGVFLEFTERARQDYYASEDGEEAPRYVLLIDEINRGNLAQIFGELITALEADKRLGGTNETTISLAHSGDRFTIPPNLYLIGTMNTADRSIALVDAALRRRFTFLSFPPRLRLLREEYDLGTWADVATTARTSGADNQLLAQSLIAVHQLNSRIRSEPDLGRGKQIGHSYFFDIETDQDIVDVWQFEVLPLLEEYFFGQYGRIQDALFTGGGSEVFDWEHQQIRAFDETELAAALGPFVEEFDAASVDAEE